MKAFLTGTDTGVGKTRVACALVRSLRARGENAVGLKPICCGDRDDAHALHEASEAALPLEVVNPVWLTTPAAPLLAARVERRSIDFAAIHAAFARAEAHEHVLVEGVGGWEVPLAPGKLLSDLAADFGLPVIVVAANRLGALNHTLLTVRAVQQRGLACAGVILNEIAEPSAETSLVRDGNRALLAEWLPVPILAELRFQERMLELPTL